MQQLDNTLFSVKNNPISTWFQTQLDIPVYHRFEFIHPLLNCFINRQPLLSFVLHFHLDE